jgi:hypothetical protein
MLSSTSYTARLVRTTPVIYQHMDLLENVGEYFHVNFVMKAFPADKPFKIW